MPVRFAKLGWTQYGQRESIPYSLWYGVMWCAVWRRRLTQMWSHCWFCQYRIQLLLPEGTASE